MSGNLILRLRTITRNLKLVRDYYLLRSSDLFDKTWYLEHNPDVAQAGENPVWHYLKRSRKAGQIHSILDYTTPVEIEASGSPVRYPSLGRMPSFPVFSPCKHHSKLKVKWEKASLNDR